MDVPIVVNGRQIDPMISRKANPVLLALLVMLGQMLFAEKFRQQI